MAQINKITNKRVKITANTTEIQRNIGKIYVNELGNLGEKGKLLEKYNLLKLKQREIENLRKLITSKEIESEIKKIPTLKTKSSRPDGFSSKFSHILKRSNIYPSQTIPKNKTRKTSKFIL